MHQEIQAIRFDVEDIGKHVKGSKKRFSWTFGLNGRNHTIILDFSFISGKVKLVVDRKTMLESELPANSSFQHPFTLDGYAINILQQGESFELRINNKVFSHLYNQAKTNTEFRNYEDQIKDIKVNESTFQNANKTVKLNIGALDGVKKKTKQTAESENWGDFGGNQNSIPSYFGESTSSQSGPQKKQLKKNKSLLDQDEESTQQSNASTQQTKKQQPKATGEVDFFAEESKTPSSVSPSQEQLGNLLGQPAEFNTMQNMFATMNVSPQPQPTKAKDTSLDLLNTASGVQAPTADNQFSTIQMLFATSSQNPTIAQQPMVTLQQQPVTLPTMGTTPVSATSDFYTIGNLFSTGSQNPALNLGQMQMNLGTGVNLPTANVGLAADGGFNTLQNLFATNNQVPQGITLSQPVQPAQPVQPVQDFNTLQNLFKTGSGVTLPTQVTPTPAKQDDPFSVLGMPPMTSTTTTQKTQIKTTTTVSSPNPMMFNTYSGPKTSTAPVIDASSFGTMQKGAAGNIDFFQNLPTQQPAQPQSQVPNFSKKKPAPTQDLI